MSTQQETQKQTNFIEDNMPPTWVSRLSAAIAEALEDGRLPEKVTGIITTLITDLDNDFCYDFPTLAKTTLPVSLYRACGFEPPIESEKQAASREEIQREVSQIRHIVSELHKLSPYLTERPVWMQRLGNTVASLYEKLDSPTFNGLGDKITEFTNTYTHTNDFEARIMLPIALDAVFDKEPTLKIYLDMPGGINRAYMAAMTEGDLSENFERFLTFLDDICVGCEKDERLETTNKNAYVVTVSAVSSDGDDVEVELFQGTVPQSRIERFCRNVGAVTGANKQEDTPKCAEASGNESFAHALTEIATDPETTQDASLKLAAIISQLRQEDERPRSAGKFIVQLIEDETLPTPIRNAVFDAAEEIMNKLNRGEEMTLAWMKIY